MRSKIKILTTPILLILLLLIIPCTKPKISKAYYPQFSQEEGESTNKTPSQIQKWEDSVYGTDQYNQESHTNETFNNLIISIIQDIGGPINPEYQAKTKKRGAIIALASMIDELYLTPPASLKEYLADLTINLGIAKPAHAQGIGFSKLQNLLPLWKASRNAAYLFIILISLYIGFSIIFRVQISPKSVATIQNSIPKLIISIILITFSYAIAGLLIDLMYLIINLGVVIIYQSGLANKSLTETQNYFSNIGLGGIFTTTIGSLVGGLWKVGGFGVATGALSLIVPFLIGFLTLGIGWVGGLLVLLLFLLVFVFKIFRLWIKLLTCYAQLILFIISGPILIAINSVPGKKGTSLQTWINGLLSNILVFPAVSLVLFLIQCLVNLRGPAWTPPLISTSGRALPSLITIAFILIIDKIPDTVKSLFKTKTPDFGGPIPIISGIYQGAKKQYFEQGGEETFKAIKNRLISLTGKSEEIEKTPKQTV